MKEDIHRCRLFHAGLIAGALVLMPLLFSCTEDLGSDMVENRQISFSISGLKANSSASTRADASRSYDVIEMDAAEGERPLYLHVSQSKDFSATEGSSSIATRGVPITSVGDGQVAIYAYRYSGAWSESLTPNFFQNDSLLTDFQGSVVTSYPWPGIDSLKFFAIPKWVYDAGATRTLTGSPSITYTVPSESASQPDIMLASNRVPGDYYSTVPLSFKHIMTGVVIKLASDFPASAVSSIKITGVNNAGTYSMADSTWTLDSTSVADFTASGVDTVTVTSGAVNTVVGGSNTFMMLPQTLPSDATLEITYTESDSTVTRRALIGSTSWPMGTIVTYTLSKSSLEFTFEVTGPDDYTYAGGTDQYQVTSYSIDGSDSTTVGWTAKFVDDNGNEIDQPEWLTAFTLSGNGSTSATDYDATVTKQDSTETNYHTLTLQSNDPKGSDTEPWDLSTNAIYSSSTAPDSTANCYLVNAPGTYCLPLVYGNGIENGVYNTGAYDRSDDSGLGANQKTHFTNYENKDITDPYIYNDNLTLKPYDAVLVWEDVKGLVSDVKLFSDNHYLEFTVSKENIAQGNAVVAVRDSNRVIMWSWHIWVTDYVLGTNVKPRTGSNGTFKIMPYNLGWVDGDTTMFARRSVKVLFTQKVTGLKDTIEIVQKADSLYSSGNCTYYQWGRKDPILPTTGFVVEGSYLIREAANKTWYDASGTASTVLATDTWLTKTYQNDTNWCVPQGIRHPDTFNLETTMDNYFHNFWSADKMHSTMPGNGYASTYSEKSIYDPCPVGYKVPVDAAFMGFSNNTNETNPNSDGELKGSVNTTLMRFEVIADDSTTIVFPNLGCREPSNNGTAVTSTVCGYYWYSISTKTTAGGAVPNARFMWLYIYFDPQTGVIDTSNWIFGIRYTASDSGKGRGCCIRPIVDENPSS